MTSRIYINIEADSADEARSEMIMLLGNAEPDGMGGYQRPRTVGDNPIKYAAYADEADLPQDAQDAKVQTEEAKPVRERGKPSPGRARRTKEEIAEDEAFERAEADAKARAEGENLDGSERRETQANISASPEDRKDPENPADDDEATAAQDEADEAAEAEAAKQPDAPMTIEDLRAVVGPYQAKYGMENAALDLPPIWKGICGEDCAKMSMIPDDKIAEVVAAIKKAYDTNQFGREVVKS